MPRYISRYTGFKKTVIKGTQTLVHGLNGPVMETLSQPHIAIFSQGGLTSEELEQAAARFGFLGVAEGEDPLRRCSVWDSDEAARYNAWTPEQKSQVEALLDAQQNAEYFRFDPAPLPPPWPRYDEILHKDAGEMIVEMVESLGLDAGQVIAYERQNLGRADVIAALEAISSEPEDIVVPA